MTSLLLFLQSYLFFLCFFLLPPPHASPPIPFSLPLPPPEPTLEHSVYSLDSGHRSLIQSILLGRCLEIHVLIKFFDVHCEYSFIVNSFILYCLLKFSFRSCLIKKIKSQMQCSEIPVWGEGGEKMKNPTSPMTKLDISFYRATC
jgi:hypothetical protein